MAAQISDLGLLEVADLIRRGELTSLSVTTALLERIDRLDGELHSMVTVLADTALVRARRADDEIARGEWRGPLHGVPVAVKDNIWAAGFPTTAGMVSLRDFVPTADATVVRRLDEAGAVILGKTRMTDGATALHHPDLPRPVNPWGADRWTGVSSSGSGVAVAAGFCFAALGTDTGGSIRLPATVANLTGIKPSWGRVSGHGLLHMSESLDCVGPIARDVADAAAVLRAIAGADPADASAASDPVPDYLAVLDRGIEGLVVGFDEEYATRGVAAPVVAALHDALRVLGDLGAVIRQIEFPSHEEELAASGVLVAIGAATHAADLPERSEPDSPEVRMLAEMGEALDAVTVARSYMVRDRFMQRMRAMFQDIDVLLLPTIDRTAPSWSEAEHGPTFGSLLRYLQILNFAGLPSVAFPVGFSEGDRPIGAQMVAGRLDEATAIRAVAAFQRATDIHTRRPPLA